MTEQSEEAERPGEQPTRVRASDTDRDHAVDRLRTHHEQGRLDAAEFDERMSAALSARYCDELPPLLADLPPEPEPAGERPLPPWARDSQSTGAWGWRRLHAVPLLPAVLIAFVVVAFIGGLTHGHFPVFLLILGGLLWWKLRGSRQHWGTRPQAADGG
jgi:hypothetical protein